MNNDQLYEEMIKAMERLEKMILALEERVNELDHRTVGSIRIGGSR